MNDNNNNNDNDNKDDEDDTDEMDVEVKGDISQNNGMNTRRQVWLVN